MLYYYTMLIYIVLYYIILYYILSRGSNAIVNIH